MRTAENRNNRSIATSPCPELIDTWNIIPPTRCYKLFLPETGKLKARKGQGWDISRVMVIVNVDRYTMTMRLWDRDHSEADEAWMSIALEISSKLPIKLTSIYSRRDQTTRDGNEAPSIARHREIPFSSDHRIPVPAGTRIDHWRVILSSRWSIFLSHRAKRKQKRSSRRHTCFARANLLFIQPFDSLRSTGTSFRLIIKVSLTIQPFHQGARMAMVRPSTFVRMFTHVHVRAYVYVSHVCPKCQPPRQ